MQINVNSNYNININDDEIKVISYKMKIIKIQIGELQELLLQILLNGVTNGFTKTLELNGTGYRASVSGSKLKLRTRL